MSGQLPTPRRRWLLSNLQRLLGLTGLSLSAAAQARPTVKGELVPWPEVTLLDGQRLSAAGLGAQALIVVFFATDCPYCKRHNSRIEALVQASQGLPLKVLGVAGDRDPALVKRYVQERGLSFPVTLDDAPLRAVLTQRRVIPLTCVLDTQQRLREVIPGEMSEDDVMQLARWASPA
jgi:peroxiredoxin